MARIRTIKPEFWTSEQIVECSTSARLLFIGLWNFCDDGGVHQYSIKRIKMQIFPGDDVGHAQIAAWLEELLTVGLLKSFAAEGVRFLHVTGWHHQKIDRPTLRFPQPSADTEFDECSTTPRRTLDEPSPPEGNGREGRLREGKEAASALPPFPESVDSPRLQQSLADWLAYKGGRSKPRTIKALVTRIANRVEAHGEQAVVDAIERAISQEYKGWDFDDWFEGKKATPQSRVVTPEEFAEMGIDLATGAGLR